MNKKRYLRLEREQRGWSQSRLAELLETSSISISQWERGVFLPSPHFREKLCTVFEKDAQTLGLALESSVEQSYRSDPFIPFQSFPTSGLVGRDAILNLLVEHLCSKLRPSTVTLHGLPGVGKTALAMALTHIPAIQDQFPDGVLWADLGLDPHPFEQLSRWGCLLQIPEMEMKVCSDLFSLAQCLRRYIGSRKFLIVLDDIWQFDAAQALEIGGCNCVHVITTRLPRLAARISEQNTFHIPELEASGGKALLAHFLPNLLDQEPEAIEQLVQRVGMLPLALILIGKHLSPYDYLGQSQRMHNALQSLCEVSTRLQLSEPQSFVAHHPSLPPEQTISLKTTIRISVQQLSVTAQQALRQLAIMPAKPDSFSQELVTALFPNGEELLHELLDAGLIEEYKDQRYTLHQTVADYTRMIVQQEDSEQERIYM